MQPNAGTVSAEVGDVVWQTLFEHLLDGVVYARLIYDRGLAVDFVYLAVNPAFMRASGLSRVVGRRASDVIPDLRASNPELIERYARVAAGGQPEKFEVFIGAIDQWYQISLSSPAPEHFVAIFNGISRRKRAEALNDSLQAHLQQAQQMQAINISSSGVAHDLNNILMAILGFADLAARDSAIANPKAQRGYLNEVRLAAERARELVQKILQPKPPAQDADGTPALNPQIPIEESLKMLNVLMPAGIVLSSLLTQVPPIRVSEIDLQQMLMNLVLNGRDAISAAGGTGTINVALTACALAQVQCTSCLATFSGNYVEVEVADSGSGVSSDASRAMFNLFYTTKAPGAGSGLGLSVVDGLVHAVGGHIVVEHLRPQGTAMRLVFKA